MELSTEQAARRLGMKTSEVVGVEETDGGAVVTTHDGQRVVVTEDAVTPLAVVLVGEAGPELAPAADAAVVAADEHERLQREAAAKGEGGEPPAELVVPEGPTQTVLDWVDNDPERAAAALADEQAKANPRSGLITALEKLVAQ
jgi:hypothetical protein